MSVPFQTPNLSLWEKREHARLHFEMFNRAYKAELIKAAPFQVGDIVQCSNRDGIWKIMEVTVHHIFDNGIGSLEYSGARQMKSGEFSTFDRKLFGYLRPVPTITYKEDPYANYPSGWEGWMKDQGRGDEI